MEPAGFWRAVLDDLKLIPVGEEAFFGRLWSQGRLRFCGEPLRAGGIEELSARLLGTALRRRTSLFVQLPRQPPSQTPALFATTLLLDAVTQSAAREPGKNRVVLFGTSVSLRSQLAQMTVGRLNLSDVFRQVQVEGEAVRPVVRADESAQLGGRLPEVICVLSPATPAKILDRYRPAWVAVDSGEGSQVDWLPQVLSEALTRRIPVIGWLSGYSGSAANQVRQAQIPLFSWPPALTDSAPKPVAAMPLTAERLLSDCISPVLQPAVVVGSLAQQIATRLFHARRELARLGRQEQTPYFRDCLQSGWRYLSALETLHVPLRFYELECRQYWGLVTVAARRETFERFISSATTFGADTRASLLGVLLSLDQVHELLQSEAPPLWEALLGVTVAEAAPEKPRSIVFPGRSRRKLFELALLAKEGITATDLASVGVSISSFTDNVVAPPPIQSRGDSDTAVVYLVGSPREEQGSRLESLLIQPNLRVLVLPHQEVEVHARIAAIAASVLVRTTHVVGALREVGLASGLPRVGPDFSYVTLGESASISTSNSLSSTDPRRSGSLWKPPESVAEAQWLLEESIADDDFQEDLSFMADEGAEAIDAAEVPFVESAIRVEFDDHRMVLLDPEMPLNVMRGRGVHEEMRPHLASDLRQGDRVVFIHGQRRQSLYDLLIRRVHDHPSIRLHLALIEMWHEEIGKAYRLWVSRTGGSYEALLEALQALGCERSSAVTVQLWISGQVISPSDPQDISRVARVLGIKSVSDHHARISKAADRLRGLHRGLALRLNGWLRENTPGRASSNEDDVFDDELGLRLSDFRESIEVLSVESADRVAGLFLRSSLTRISSR